MTIKQKVWLSILLSAVAGLAGLFAISLISQNVTRSLENNYRLILMLNDLNHSTYAFVKGDLQYDEITKKYDKVLSYAQKLNYTDLVAILQKGKNTLKRINELFKRNEEIKKQIWHYSDDSYQQSKKYTEEAVAKLLKGEELSTLEKKVILGAHANTTYSLLVREKFLEVTKDISKAEDLFAFIDSLIENSRRDMERLKGTPLVVLPERATANNEKIKELAGEYVQNVKTLKELSEDFCSKLMGETRAVANDIQMAVKADMRKVMTSSLTAFLALLCVLIFVILNIVVGILKDMNSLLGVAGTLSGGDLTTRFNTRRRDEVGTIGRRFNLAVDGLQDMIRIIINTMNISRRIVDLSGKLSKAVENMERRLKEVLPQARERIEGASEAVQRASDSIRKMLEETAASTQNLSVSAQRLSEKNQLVKEAAEQGNKAVLGISDVVQQASARTKDMDAVVSKLVDYAQNIETILDAITSIAEQTSALALQGVREAARAGEAGRGFAIVADEIRKLAEENKKATDQIAQTLSLTCEGVDQVRQKTSEVVKLVEASVEQVDVATGAFKDIQVQVDEISSLISETTASAEEFSATSQEVENNTAAIMESIANVASNVKELSVLYESLKEAEKLIRDTADRLMALADVLEKNASKFTV